MTTRNQTQSWEDSLEVVLKFQEEFQIWIIEVTRVSSSDKEFVCNSLMDLLDAEWTKRMKEDKSLKHKDLDQISSSSWTGFLLLPDGWTKKDSKKETTNSQVHSWKEYFHAVNELSLTMYHLWQECL